MDCRNIVVYMAHTETYPLRLARVIGLDCAVLFYQLFRKYGDLSFRDLGDFGIQFGVLDTKKTLEKLKEHHYIVLDELGSMILNLDKLFDQADGASLAHDIKPPFTDDKFLTACSDYMHMLRRKGRTADRKAIYAKFEGKTLEQSIEALKFSLKEEYVTIFFPNARQQKTSVDKGNAQRLPNRTGVRNYGRGGSPVQEQGTRTYSADEI